MQTKCNIIFKLLHIRCETLEMVKKKSARTESRQNKNCIKKENYKIFRHLFKRQFKKMEVKIERYSGHIIQHSN